MSFVPLRRLTERHQDAALATPIASLYLSVTRQCNLTCAYCSADAGPDVHESMPLDRALAAVDTWLGGAVGAYHQLVFSGGEPTLWGYDRLDAVCEHAVFRARQRGVRLRIGVQTNGTNMGDRFVEWCRRFGVEPSISLDGPPWLSDERRGSGERTERGIRRLQFERIPFAVIACLSRDLIARIDEVLSYFRQMGVRKLRLNTLGTPPDGRHAEPVTCELLLAAKVAVYRHRELNGVGALHELNVERQLAWFDAAITGRPVVHGHCVQEQCGAGRDVAAVNPDGSVSPCIERSMTGGLPVASALSGADAVMKGYWQARPRWTKCSSCRARPICDHGCPVYHDGQEHAFEHECRANREFWDYLVRERGVTVLKAFGSSPP